MKYLSGTPALSLACVMLLGACGTAYPGSAQRCAGINEASIAFTPRRGEIKADLCGGKENERVRLSGKTPDGLEFTYEADGVSAFAGQMTQAEFNASLSRDRVEIVREIAGALQRRITP